MYQVSKPGPTPLVKWAGGKAKMIPALLENMPPQFNRFHTLFAGGAALALHVGVAGGIFCDSCDDLISFYNVVRFRTESLIQCLDEMQNIYNHKPNDREREKLYYSIRERHNQHDGMEDAIRASEFLFLNKAGFNGLYRLNKKGEFNAPWGHRKKVTLINDTIVENMLDVAELLREMLVVCVDYQNVLYSIAPRDFVYADPPYHTMNANGLAYNSNHKDWLRGVTQQALRDHLDTLAESGVCVMTTNADTPLIRELYKNWRIFEVEMPGRISGKAKGRKDHIELIMTSYSPDTATGYEVDVEKGVGW